MNSYSSKITAITLIYNILDLERLLPNIDDWELEKQKGNPPRYVRLQQIDALFKVFTPSYYKDGDIVTGVWNFMEGQFILSRGINEYNKVIKVMDKEINASDRSFEKEVWDLYHIQHNYRDLLRFKKSISQVKSHNSGMMEMSYPYFYSYLASNKILDKINCDEIDKFLSLVIDPLGRSFTVEELIRDYNYPKDNLGDIDFDWM